MSLPVTYPPNPTPEQLVAALRQLSPTARVLARLQHLLSDPNSGLDDIAALLRLDASLVTRVIQVSNSIIFRRGDPCRTIDEAVNRIGFREIFRLVAIVASNAVASGPYPAYGLNAEDVWVQSVGNALAAELIAEQTGEDYSTAYTAGLLQTIGRMPINQYSLHLDPNRRFVDTGFPNDFSSAELALLSYDQAKVSAFMLKKWEFPPALIKPVQHQYEPLLAPEPHDTLAAVIYAGRLLRTLHTDGLAVPFATEEDEILGSLRLDRDKLGQMLPQFEMQLVRARQITAAMQIRTGSH